MTRASPQQEHGCPSKDQWFTPFWAPEMLVDDALRGLGVVHVAEPACGSGAFLAAVPEACPAFGIDIDPAIIGVAAANSGREVILGDFRTVDLANRRVEAIIGNPPFQNAVIDAFLARSLDILPEDGLVAMILPAYAFKAASRVGRWMDSFSIDVNLIPQTLFPRLRWPIVWAKYRKGRARRFHGLMLFTEQREIEQMRPVIRRALERPGTWREAVRIALESLGGQSSLAGIYDRIAPERRAGQHWQPKVRQILQMHFQRVGEGRWALPA